MTALVVLTFTAPMALAFALRKTKLWWLAGALTFATGIAMFCTLDHSSHDHGDDGMGAWDGIGNFLQMVYGGFLLVYGMMVLAFAAPRAKQPPPPPPPPELPQARIV